MRCNAFVEAWKNHHRRASMILGLSLLSAPLSYSVYAEDGVSNTMVQVVTQTKTVKGTIIDESGEPLIGVSIVVKGTSTGTITDFNGNFSIDLPAGRKELVRFYTNFFIITIISTFRHINRLHRSTHIFQFTLIAQTPDMSHGCASCHSTKRLEVISPHKWVSPEVLCQLQVNFLVR